MSGEVEKTGKVAEHFRDVFEATGSVVIQEHFEGVEKWSGKLKVLSLLMKGFTS